MNRFGDVLRGLGSVLNPQVAQEVAREDQQQLQMANQVGMLGLQQRFQKEAEDRAYQRQIASPEYQAKVEALKNERLFREEVGAASGDMTKIAGAAVKYGKPEVAVSIFNHHEAVQARKEQAANTLRVELAKIEQQSLDKALDRESKERLAAQAEETKKMLAAAQIEVARGNQELKKLQFTMKADQGLQRSVQQLGGALEKAGLPTADAVLADVEAALGDDQKKAAHLSSYIAGANSWKPDMTSGDDVKKLRQAATKLFNITLKDRSGAAVTNQELERLKQEFATGVWKSPEQFMNGVKKARGIINKHYASVAAGFGPEALTAYNENIRGFGGRVVLEGGKVEDPLGIR